MVPGAVTERATLSAIAVVAAALILGLTLIGRSSDSSFDPTVRANPIVDLLGWLPATDQSRRAYAAWVEQPGAPLDLTSASDRLSILPPPLALGRSSEWQRTTGISASQVTGWASAPGAGVTVLTGTFDAAEITSRLGQADYRSTLYRSVPIWLSPAQIDTSRVIEGDDLHASNAIAVYQDRVVIGWDERAVRRSLMPRPACRVRLRPTHPSTRQTSRPACPGSWSRISGIWLSIVGLPRGGGKPTSRSLRATLWLSSTMSMIPGHR